MKELLAGAAVTLVAVWSFGLALGWWRRRREAKRNEVSPAWLNEHGARRWK